MLIDEDAVAGDESTEDAFAGESERLGELGGQEIVGRDRRHDMLQVHQVDEKADDRHRQVLTSVQLRLPDDAVEESLVTRNDLGKHDDRAPVDDEGDRTLGHDEVEEALALLFLGPWLEEDAALRPRPSPDGVEHVRGQELDFLTETLSYKINSVRSLAFSAWLHFRYMSVVVHAVAPL